MLAERTSSDAALLTIGLLDGLFGNSLKGVGFRLWDGTPWPDDRSRPATVVLNHPGALRGMLLPGSELGLAEAYLRDEFDVEGDMETAFEVYDALEGPSLGWGGRLGAAFHLRRLPNGRAARAKQPLRARLRGISHSPARDMQAIRHHYDLSNWFYSLWLDSRMVYSCAYFNSHDDQLDEAQERKLDYVCRKLRLRPGQRLLDIGCGWGGLIMRAARRYGVDATGITLSDAQASHAFRIIKEAGLSGRCRVKVMDYREVDEDEPFDALVSIGMFEHVGASVLPVYFNKALRLLRPGGVFLNHGIARRQDTRPAGGPDFINTYVFPDGELVPINDTIRAAEDAGLEVRDVESLREHYTLTLRRWVKNLEQNRDEAIRCAGETAYRVWRLYMAGSAYWFRTGRNSVYQTLLARPDGCGASGLPLTRADWY